VFDPSTVTVTVSRLNDRPYGELPNDLERAIGDRTDENPTVMVQFRDYERSNVTSPQQARATSVV